MTPGFQLAFAFLIPLTIYARFSLWLRDREITRNHKLLSK